MAMPTNLILVRHGESEGNIAVRRSKGGDHRDYTEAFKARHSSKWRLSPKGVEQAKTTGAWFRSELGHIHFDRCYVSEYVRAVETAGHLELPNDDWRLELYLRERTWGDLDVRSVEEREARFQESWKARRSSPFYWTPPNGESLADLCLRVDRVIDTLHRECPNKNVIIVCHGEVMWAFRRRLERMTEARFLELEHSRDPRDQINNCQVIHYTRCDPSDIMAASAPYLNWMRSVCPWKEDWQSDNVWQPIKRERYTNAQLLELAHQTEPMVTE
jgi:broad specificity phosphatase PhoE